MSEIVVKPLYILGRISKMDGWLMVAGCEDVDDGGGILRHLLVAIARSDLDQGP